MKLCKFLHKLLNILIIFFVVTFIVYWFNLDMKLVRRLYDRLQKHYDDLEKDRRL